VEFLATESSFRRERRDTRQVSGDAHDSTVVDMRLGAAVRRVRQAHGWRQADVAVRAGISDSTISRIERGDIDKISVATVRALANALGMRVDLVPRWRGGDLDRLVNRAHSALHESVADSFRRRWPAWVLVPEATFSIYGERGAMDLLAWHPGRRAVLVIELKTEIVDVNELLGTFDRKRRLAANVAAERGWSPIVVGAWLVVSASTTNRRRARAHATMLSSALPDGRATLQRWLVDPVGSVSALSFWSGSRQEGVKPRSGTIRRVRAPARASMSDQRGE
jgi:transcriptional regulator with XRE-family HTH domain